MGMHTRRHKQRLCECSTGECWWRSATCLALSETRCLTSCEGNSQQALMPPDVGPFYLGVPRQSRPWHEMAQPIRRLKTALHPLFLLALLRRTLQRKTAIDVHTEPTPPDAAVSLALASPRAPGPGRAACMAYGHSHLCGRWWATSCHRAVSQLSQLFS